ncbi:non-ribosomal peptide synthetase [Kitasatospora sp. LaBMicrA B282]|uniref:non-ribosomal peptide synthetase n=1 Tax=Kitasatospora sp. LaBMicrA B282 TaxID=3420949 RepID=UPI003D0DB2BF
MTTDVPALLAGLSEEQLTALVGQLEPISVNQLRLWISQEFDPRSNAYNVARCLRLTGPLDEPALARALHALVERHEVLRTVFVEHRDQVHQLVLDPDPAPAPAEPLDPVELPELARRFTMQPFDLRAEPPFRARLLRTGEDEHVLLLAFHHIAVDGWSLGIFERELAEAYCSFAGTGDWRPAAEPAQAADFARWQRETLTPELVEQQLAYWRGALPADRPQSSLLAARPLRSTGPGAALAHVTEVPADVARTVEELAGASAATTFTVLQTAVQVLLQRFTGQTGIVLGTTTLNRKRPEFESALGFFVNTVALHTDLADQPSFTEALRRAKETVLGALSHDDLPFDRVVEAVSARVAGEGGALFQVAVELQPAPAGPAGRWGALAVEVSSPLDKRAKFDLALFFFRVPQGLQLMVEYDSALFDEAYVAGLVRALFTLLRAAGQAPERSIAELALVDAAAEAELRVLRTAPAPAPVAPTTELIRALAAHGARTGVRSADEELDFAELVRRAEAVAEALTARGTRPGSFVGVVADRSVHSIVAVLGCWLARCAYVPIDPALPEDRRRYMIEDSGLTSILGPAGFEAFGAEPIDVRAWSLSGRALDPATAPVTEPGDLAYAIYTSGTTGTPKAVLTTHANLHHFMAGLGETYRVTDWRQEVCSLNAPLIFDVTVQQLLALLAGASLAIVPGPVRLDPEAMLDYVERAGITLLECIPPHLQLLVEAGLLERPGLALRRLVTGGEALPAPLWPVLADSRLTVFNVYGPTECTVNSTFTVVDAAAERPSIGKELPGVSLFVADQEGRLVPYGACGELFVGGGGVGPGYLGRPELTAERFVERPWGPQGEPVRVYRTGDQVRLAKGGVVEYLGRLDDQVKIRGNRIELGEVTARLLAHSAVTAAVTVVDDSDPRGANLHAFVVSGDERLGGAELRQYLRGFLPEYMVPQRISRLAALPVTVIGKVDQRALRELCRQAAAEAPPAPRERLAPADATERLLVELWRELLRQPDADAAAHFFASGGHSLLAARLISRIRSAFGPGLTIADLVERPTPRQFADLVRNRPSGPARGLVTLAEGAGGAPVICLHPLGGDVLVYRELVDAFPLDRPVYGVADRRTDPRTRTGWDTPEQMLDAYAAEIAELVGGGPCHLVGWSLGGLIAHGTAHRLERLGVEVRSLTLWDTGLAAERVERPAEPDWAAGILPVLHALAPQGAPPIPAREHRRLAAEAAELPVAAAGTWVLDTAEQLWGERPAADPQTVTDRIAVAALHRWLFTGWQAPVVRAPMQIAWAGDSLDRRLITRTRWADHTTAQLRESEVAGTHYSITTGVTVKELAAELAEFVTTMEELPR